jgi:hypothetical protein
MSLHVSNLPDGATATVLLMGVRGEKCNGNQIAKTNGSGDLSLANQVEEHCWTCSAPEAGPPRIAVFSRGRAASYMAPEQVCSASSETLNIALAERRKLDVDVWVRSAELIPLAKDELVNADWVLDKNLTGIALAVRRVEVLPNPLDVPQDCIKADQQTTASRFFDPKALNVYYGIGINIACKQPVVFTNEGTQLLGDMAHEISHALGLKKRDQEHNYQGGHTNFRGQPVNGFDCNNVMWTNSLILDHALSLGQAFWMNFSDSSLAVSSQLRLLCSEKDGDSSPCVPISTGSVLEDAGPCRSCTLEAAPTTPRHCTPQEAGNLLAERYAELTEHARRYGLEMGSQSLDEMDRRWTPATAIAMVATPVSEAIPLAKSDADRQRYLSYLKNAVAKYGAGRLANYEYVYRLVEQGKFGRLRCAYE